MNTARVPLMPVLFCSAILCLCINVSGRGDALTEPAFAFIEDHCLDCHDSFEKKADFDLETLAFDLEDRESFTHWVHVYDRVLAGEMPPEKRKRPDSAALDGFLEALSEPLLKADRKRIAENGRSKVRRLNRFEYENTLKALLEAPWLQVADRLPEDGIDHLYNKIGERLDVSHVQMAKYLEVAEYALRTAVNTAAHPTEIRKFYAREEPVVNNYLNYRGGQKAATRASIPLLGFQPEVEVIRGNQPVTVGEADPKRREREAFGVVSGTYTATTKYDFTRINAPIDGNYRLRLKSYTFRAGPNGRRGGDDHGLTGGDEAWWRPDRNVAMPGLRSEPITLYALSDSGDSRWLTTYDAYPQPHVIEREVTLRQGENIRPDAGRLVRTRPGWKGNPNASVKDGIPGYAMNWLEVEGPLHEEWPPKSYQTVFGDLAFESCEPGHVEALSSHPEKDAQRLLLDFTRRAYQRRVGPSEIAPFMAIYRRATELGESFTDAMIATCASVLCSSDFLYFGTRPGPLKNREIASRLSYFLWNGPPDDTLNAVSNLKSPAKLSQQSERMLNDPKSERFVNAFLGYWLDLRDVNANTPDAELYPDYYLDDQLTEASILETRRYFRELLDNDLPARNLVDSDFTFVNERLAAHYGFEPFEGVQLRRVDIPPQSPRGGLMTQASVLRVTANGTTTSPVLRGVWIMERILGAHIQPPPSGVEAVEPDTRGATTIREQLDLHRADQSCNSCHAKIDPTGFALESFDIAGGWRDRYRAVGEIGEPAQGYGKNGHEFIFRNAAPVDSSGYLPNGEPFADIEELKGLLVKDERTIARNLVRQFLVYATGAPVSFSDRIHVEKILDHCEDSQYGVRSLLSAVVQSELFAIK